MHCNDFEILMNEYNDGELQKEKEPLLFAHLAQCERCREDFKLYSNMQFKYREKFDEYPDTLDSRIMATLKNRQPVPDKTLFQKQVPVYYLQAAVVAVLALVVYVVFQMREFDYRIENQKSQYMQIFEAVRYQEQQMNRLMDDAPSAKVRAVIDNTEIQKKQM